MQLLLHKRGELLLEELVWCSIPSCFSGTVIDEVDGLFYLVARDRAKIRLLWKELSKEPVSVLIDAALSG